MTFDINQPIYDKEGYFLEEEVIAYQDELMARFAKSPEGKAILLDKDPHWAELFMDMVLRRLGMQLRYIYTEDIRFILYEVIPEKAVINSDDVPAMIEELKAFFRFLKRAFSLPNADACLKVLNQKNLLKKVTEELNNPDNYSPTKAIIIQMLDAGVDPTDETQVAKFIEDYNAKITEAMKPPPITEKAQEQHKAVKKLIRKVCTDVLNKEYYDMSIKLLDKFLFEHANRLERGQANSWAAAIVYTIGRVNFLFDPSQEPHLSAGELAQKFGISQGTASKKASELFDLFDLTQFHPEWTLPSMADANPFIWNVMIDGLIVDIRYQPREMQVMAYQQGLIPYIPADKK